ncbi:Cardioacceleratory peptide receptor [Lamellibrachia satsuma]|nr:Cardioacceleratory peptide receptor [Lamellibrachia satsuma]
MPSRQLLHLYAHRRAKILIATAWALSFIFAIPQIVLFEDQIWAQDNKHHCGIHLFSTAQHWQIYLMPIAISLFFLPGIIITFCYVMIIFTIFSKSKIMAANAGTARNGGVRSRTDRQPLDSTSSSRGIIPQAKIRTIKMTLVIVIVFILCWSPYFIFNLIDVFDGLPQTERIHHLRIFIQTVAPLNSAINPIIYGIFSTRICHNLRRIRALDWILSRVCCRPSPGEPTRSSRSTSMATYTLYADSHRTTAGSHSRRLSEQSRRASGPSCLHSPLKKREADIVMRNLQRDRNNKCPDVTSVS